MAEPEVESILREIRERVLSQQRSGHDAAASVRVTTGNHANGASESGPTEQITRRGAPQSVVAESLALIDSYLTTTARSWDRLPPLVSNRSGAAARLELWIKQHLKRATRWYAWEQVNFNAAVHQALRDVLQVLAAYEREWDSLHRQAERQQIEFERNQTELATLRDEIAAQRVKMQVELATLRAEIAAQRVKMQAETGLTNTHRAQIEGRLTELHKELRERDEHLRDEQRVCFKQLALETSEAAMLEDRARQKSKASLEKLTRRVEQLEK